MRFSKRSERMPWRWTQPLTAVAYVKQLDAERETSGKLYLDSSSNA